MHLLLALCSLKGCALGCQTSDGGVVVVVGGRHELVVALGVLGIALLFQLDVALELLHLGQRLKKKRKEDLKMGRIA